jgi:hypothetical protein
VSLFTSIHIAAADYQHLAFPFTEKEHHKQSPRFSSTHRRIQVLIPHLPALEKSDMRLSIKYFFNLIRLDIVLADQLGFHPKWNNNLGNLQVKAPNLNYPFDNITSVASTS